MAVVQTYTLDLTNHSNPVVVPVSQFDVGRQIKFNIKNNGSTYDVGSYSVIMQGRFQNGRGFSIAGSTSGSTATITCTRESTAFYGRVMAELRFAKGSETVGTMNFVWEVEEGPEYQTSITQDDLSIFQQLLAQSQASAGAAQSYAQQSQASAGAAQSYAQQAQTIANSLNVEKRYVFIGDSYGAGFNMSNTSANWINKIKTYMGLSSSRAFSSAVTGSGFIGQNNVITFREQFNNLSISSPETITDVVVLGGWNDGGKDAAELLSAINSFIDAVEVKCPKATTHIGYVSWCDSYKRHNVANENNPTMAIRDAFSVYSKCGRHGAAFIEGLQYAMHNMTFFTSDGLHPNEAGQEAIASHLANYLRGGTISVIYENWRDERAAAANPGGTSAWIYTYLNNNRCRLLLYKEDGFRVNFSSAVSFNKAAGFGGNGTQYHDVFTFSDNCCLRGGRYGELQYSGPCMYKANGTWYEVQGFLRVGRPDEGKSNTLQVALAKSTGSDYASITGVTEIWFPQNNVFMEADPMHC